MLSFAEAFDIFHKKHKNETVLGYWKDQDGYLFQIALKGPLDYRSAIYRVSNEGTVSVSFAFEEPTVYSSKMIPV